MLEEFLERLDKYIEENIKGVGVAVGILIAFVLGVVVL